ncbi:MAG: hypothetical protein M1839_000682 [Geoglossum umbratile]|nr:MAG: hypothetical protein M1839_000682 [Geoglossum umbratile]
MSFWDKMQVWEKMCLVLAVAIALTVFAGLGKVAWNHWTLRRYEAIAEAKKAHLREMRESRRIIQLQGEGIPFGIRAIEAGIEVEGVHISRPATPTIRHFRNVSNGSISSNGTKLSPGQTPALGRPTGEAAAPNTEQVDASDADSRHQERNSSTAGGRHLFMPQPVYGPQSVVRGAPGDQQSHQSPSSTNGTGPRYVPRNSSHLRFSDQGPIADVDTLDRLEGQKAVGSRAVENVKPNTSPKLGIRIPSANLSLFEPKEASPTLANKHQPTQLHQSSESAQGKKCERNSASSGSSSDRNSMPPNRSSRVQFQSLAPPNRDETPSVEGKREHLDSLQSHRLSHAAEVGQLLPRARRAANGDRTGAKPSASASAKPGDELLPSADNPFATPGTSPVEDAKGSRIHPVRNLGEGSYDSGKGRLTKQYGPGSIQPPSSSHVPVIRKVNSGFEILAPGTFGMPDVKGTGIRHSDIDLDLETGERGQQHRSKFVEKLRRGRISNFTESL